MDEPFGALDALTREKMQEELHAIWRRTAMTVVFLTHSVEEAVYLGTDVVVMSPRPGRIIERHEVGFSGRAVIGITSAASRRAPNLSESGSMSWV
jgi:ABC-type taurine transport system ATPase subunit